MSARISEEKAQRVYKHTSKRGINDVSELHNNPEGLNPSEMRMDSSERQYLKEQGIIDYKRRERRWKLTLLGFAFVTFLIGTGYLLYSKRDNMTKVSDRPPKITSPRMTEGGAIDFTKIIQMEHAGEEGYETVKYEYDLPYQTWLDVYERLERDRRLLGEDEYQRLKIFYQEQEKLGKDPSRGIGIMVTKEGQTRTDIGPGDFRRVE